jgi:hypothetical protein
MKLRYHISIFTIPGLVCVPLVFGACSNAADPAAAAAATTARATWHPAATPQVPRVAVRHSRSPLQRLLEAVGNVPVSADQRAQLDEVAAETKPKAIATRATRDAVLQTLATQVAQGVIDRPALQPTLDAMRAAASDERTADHAAIARVRGILTASQLSSIQDSMSERPSELRPTAHQHRPHLPRLLRRLGLSEEQALQMHAARQIARKEQLQALLQHRGRPYALTPLPHIQRRLSLLEHVIPILTVAQRSIVAQRLSPSPRVQPGDDQLVPVGTRNGFVGWTGGAL